VRRLVTVDRLIGRDVELSNGVLMARTACAQLKPRAARCASIAAYSAGRLKSLERSAVSP